MPSAADFFTVELYKGVAERPLSSCSSSLPLPPDARGLGSCCQEDAQGQAGVARECRCASGAQRSKAGREQVPSSYLQAASQLVSSAHAR